MKCRYDSSSWSIFFFLALEHSRKFRFLLFKIQDLDFIEISLIFSKRKSLKIRKPDHTEKNFFRQLNWTNLSFLVFILSEPRYWFVSVSIYHLSWIQHVPRVKIFFLFIYQNWSLCHSNIDLEYCNYVHAILLIFFGCFSNNRLYRKNFIICVAKLCFEDVKSEASQK